MADQSHNGRNATHRPHGGPEERGIDIAEHPTVTGSGQIIWSVRDLLFAPGRKAAAERLRRSQR